MEGHVLMSAKERTRLRIMGLVESGSLTLNQAAENIHVSYRQMKRIWSRYRAEGEKGLLHKGRGSESNRRIDEGIRDQVMRRYQERYLGFGPTLAAEKLEKDGYRLNKETLRQWLLAEGLWERQRKSSPHRSRRERKEHFGELVQLDGSFHRWFGEGYGQSCLMNMVDDATGRTMSLLAEEETTEAALQLLWRWIDQYGIPMALYCDRKNVYTTDREPTIEEQLAGIHPVSQFGRVCEKLGIEIITAYSPQAKGRVERNHGVYQDRFVKELYLEGIHTIGEANRLLERSFADELNQRFAKDPVNVEDFHVQFGKETKLEEIICFENVRTVSNDWIIQYKTRLFQILKDNRRLPAKKTKIIVQEWLDGSIHLIYEKKELKFEEILMKEKRKERMAS